MVVQAQARITESLDELRRFVAQYRRLFVLTGAGCSTDSGIPDYRDAQGQWKRAQPVTLQAFVGEAATRRRYWARSMAGWPRIEQARPNATHRALQWLQARGRIRCLLTQNVDGLHQRAGSTPVIDLHGRLDRVVCRSCAWSGPRAQWQRRLEQLNPGWLHRAAPAAPDGDADLEGAPFDEFVVPDCAQCGGIVKPDVVFFGETVPRERVDAAMAALTDSDAMLVVGSSLMVFSGFRFARAAAQMPIPLAAVGLGRTRADDLLAFRVRADCATALGACVDPQA